MDWESAERELFGDTLSCEDVLPFGFEVLPTEACARTDETAAALLNALALLDERMPRDGEDAAAPALEFARLEAKIDLLLGIAGELLRRAGPALEPVALAWSPLGLRAALAAAPVPGERGLLRLKPDHRLPQWLELPARIVAARPAAVGATVWFRFESLDPALQDALERHLFARHRRRVARARLVRA